MTDAADRRKVVLLLGICQWPDWRWVQSVYLHWMHHEDHWVAGAAITGLGHLARCARRMDKAIVVPALEALVQNRPAMAGKIENALDDIAMFTE